MNILTSDDTPSVKKTVKVDCQAISLTERSRWFCQRLARALGSRGALTALSNGVILSSIINTKVFYEVSVSLSTTSLELASSSVDFYSQHSEFLIDRPGKGVLFDRQIKLQSSHLVLTCEFPSPETKLSILVYTLQPRWRFSHLSPSDLTNVS